MPEQIATAKKSTVRKPKLTEKTIEVEIDVDNFTNEDYEKMYDWATGNVGKYTVSEIFDIMDRVIIGGFRHRRFVDMRATIKSMLEQLNDLAVGNGQKN